VPQLAPTFASSPRRGVCLRGAAVASVLFLGLGCVAHRSGDAVRSTHFVGNKRPPSPVEWLLAEQTDRALRNAMTHPKGSWQSFLFPGAIEPTWVDPEMLDRDGWRLEVWYANHGYFDARFLGWEVSRPWRPERRRTRPVDLVGHVEQGVPSRLSSIDIGGIEKLGAPLARRIWSQLAFEKGDIWSTDDWRRSLAAMEGLLRERSFAFARVEGQVAVDPAEHEVQVSIDVNAGHPCRFGKVTITGLTHIDSDELLPLVEFHEGEPYRDSALKRTREKLFGLGVLGVVNILPDLSDPEGRTVPVRIELSETKSHEVRAGPKFQFEPGLQTLSVAATYTDNNVFNRLWQTSQTASIGVASDATELGDVSTTRISPVGSVSGTFNLPRLFESKFTLLNSGSIGRDLTTYGDLLRAEYAPAVLWAGVPHLSPTIGYRIRYEQQLGTTDLCSLEDSGYGVASEYPYLLSMLEQGVVYDGRNDPVSPTRGWYWSLNLAEAGGPLGGLYDFVRAQGEVRVYRSILRLGHQDAGTIVAARLGAGIIQPYSDTSKVPIEERFFLGGGTSVRGWAANHLGPYDTSASCSRDTIPIGGDLEMHGSIELRQPLPFYPDLTIATFLDAGRVWDTPDNFNVSEIQYSVGGGVRYNTAIGPIRFDIAWRLGDPRYFGGTYSTYHDLRYPSYEGSLPAGAPNMIDVPPEARWVPHFGLSEAF